MRFYTKYISSLFSLALFLQSCSGTGYIGNFVKRSYGETRKIDPTVTLKTDDSLVVFVPLIQLRKILDYQTCLDIQATRFKHDVFNHDIKGVDYTYYEWFEPVPRVWTSRSLFSGRIIQDTEINYYKEFFIIPLQKLFNKKVPYTITKINESERKNIIEHELGKIERTLRDSSVKELAISDELCTQLKFYNKRYFLITNIFEYLLNNDYNPLYGDIDFIWYRILVVDIVSKKIILYNNKSDSFSLLSGIRSNSLYGGLKYTIKRLKQILPKKNKYAN